MWVFASTFVPIYRSLHFWLASPWVPRPTSTSSSSRAQKILLRFRTRLLRKSNRFPSVLSARRPMISFPRVLPYNPSARKEYRKRKRPSAPPQNPHHPAHHAENVMGEGIPNRLETGRPLFPEPMLHILDRSRRRPEVRCHISSNRPMLTSVKVWIPLA